MNTKIDNKDFEEMIISYSIKNAMFFESIKNHLSTSSYKSKSYFQDAKNQLIFNLLTRWFNKYSTIPSKKECNLLLERAVEDTDLKILVKSMIDYYYAVDVSMYNDAFVKDETEKYIKLNQFNEAFLLSQVDYEKGNFNEIGNRFASLNSSVFQVKNTHTVVSASESIQSLVDLIEKEQNIKKISSGYSDLDLALDGGFRPSNFYVFAAVSGGGKSILLLQYALNAVKQGNRVLYISLEMDDFTIQNRINLNLLPINYSDKEAINLSYKTTKAAFISDLQKARSCLTGELVIHYADSLGITCNDYKKLLNKEKFDMLVIDYMGIMNTNDNNHQEQPHFKYKQIAEELRELSKLYGIPVLTANQLNSEGYKTKEISLTNVSYSTGISFTADFVAAITPDGDYFSILKSRNGITQVFDLKMNKAKYKVESVRKAIENNENADKKIEGIINNE